ncbi:MAG TPA: GNAT family N-acetyltransferase [Thermomicrobiales bacterium]|nr:GNAT family N-acetyltransferase [Thermomicrobiales bacterium]
MDPALVERLNPLFDPGVEWDPAEGQTFLDNPDNAFFVAKYNGVIAGFLTAHRLQRFDKRRAEVLLYEIGVDERYRRLGLGTALVAAVKEWAAEVGADEVWVLTEQDNLPALSLYRSAGPADEMADVVMFTYEV